MPNKLHVLYADDDEALREIVRDILEDAGFNVTLACCGNDAFELIESTVTSQELASHEAIGRPTSTLPPIHLVISDVRMSPGTGIELLRRIRRLKREASLVPPVLIVTTLLEGGEPYLRALGANRVLVKPFNPDLLLNTIQEILGEVPTSR